MNNAFPIDFDSLQKGDFIRQEQIEKIYLQKWRDDPNAYRFAQMKLMGEIRAHRRDLDAHVKSTDNDIEILDDLRADAHTHKQIQQAQGKMATFVVRRGAINRSGFTAEEQARADSRDRISQAELAGLRSAREKAERDELMFAAQQKPAELQK